MDVDLALESPWDDNPQALQDSEWSKISSDFHNVGYREGITAGKESALQAGFDEGFAETGAPLGRQIGLLRGMASVVLAILTSPNPPLSIPQTTRGELVEEARVLMSSLNDIRFSDIAPPDLQAEQHAREHLESADEDDRDMDIEFGEELSSKREMESLEDLMNRMGAGPSSKQGRPTADVTKLTEKLASLSSRMGLSLPLPNRS
ncbi:Protein YAE1 [Abortiporus biennis]